MQRCQDRLDSDDLADVFLFDPSDLLADPSVSGLSPGSMSAFSVIPRLLRNSRENPDSALTTKCIERPKAAVCAAFKLLQRGLPLRSFAATAKPCLARTRAIGDKPVRAKAQRSNSARFDSLLVLHPSGKRSSAVAGSSFARADQKVAVVLQHMR